MSRSRGPKKVSRLDSSEQKNDPSGVIGDTRAVLVVVVDGHGTRTPPGPKQSTTTVEVVGNTVVVDGQGMRTPPGPKQSTTTVEAVGKVVVDVVPV